MTTPTSSYPAEKSHTYLSYGWEKCKRQPLVPIGESLGDILSFRHIGVAATTAALIGASLSLRSGNRTQFNRYLRARVVFQGVTVVAMVAGALILTNKSENIQGQRDRVLKGELPPDASSTEGKTTLQNPFGSSSTSSTPIDDSTPSSTSLTTDTRSDVGGAYPPREKMRVSDFAKRLREAESMQKEEDAQRRR